MKIFIFDMPEQHNRHVAVITAESYRDVVLALILY